MLASADGILIPGGFGGRGLEGKIQRRAGRPRAADPLPGHLPGDARRGQRVRPQRRRHGGRQLDRVRPRDALPGDRPAARAEGGRRPRRHDAPRRRPDQAARRHARARDLRRGGHLRAPPPPLRGQQPAAQAPAERRACASPAPRPTSASSRSSSSTTTRSSSPRSSTPSSSRAPSAPRRCSASFVAAALERAGPQRRGRVRVQDARASSPPGRRRARRPAVTRRRAAVRLGDARAALPERDLRRAVPHREPLAARARLRRAGDRRAARARHRGRTRTAPGAPIGSDCGNLLARDPRRGRRRRLARRPTLAAAVRAPRHRAAAGAGRAGAARRLLGERQRGDPRRRQQGGRRGAARARAARAHARARRSTSSCCSPSARRSRWPGAREFDAVRLRSDFGYVFDHASPIGEVIVASPCHYRIEARFRGAAAHAGIRPEDGPQRDPRGRAARSPRCAIGRVEDETTVNVGTIAGGTAINVVPERVLARRRGARPRRRARARRSWPRSSTASTRRPTSPTATATWTSASSARSPATACAVGAPAVRVAEAALRACGYEPVRISSGGGSDANALIAAGLPDRQPRERHRAQPRARRACQRAPRSRRCSTSRSRCSTRRRRSPGRGR